MRRVRTVTQAIVHGTTITLTFLTGALLSSHAEAVTIVMQVQACSVSTATMVIATAFFRSVRSWSHFRMWGMSKILCNLKKGL